MGLRDRLRRAASGAYEETSNQTHCEDYNQPYTAAAPMVQIVPAPGKARMRVHKACGQRVRARCVAAARVEAAEASERLTQAVQSGSCAAFDTAKAAADRAQRRLDELTGTAARAGRDGPAARSG
ncbi:hypothetical protein Franean1_6271 [Parafrankia sp. EAN1pec]|nr:hypothetical protein Franean1_6271 [Frankia sp. EAN1pec]